MLHARFEDRGGALVVTPYARRLDAALARDLHDVIGEHARGRRVVVVSLAHVESLDASALAALVAALRGLGPGGTLRLAHVRPAVRSLLDATFLDELFPSYSDADEAARA